MYQILTDNNFSKAVKEIPLKSAICRYQRKIENEYDTPYEIWEISDEDFTILDSYKDAYDYFEEGENPEIWKEEWGWWRWHSGSNINAHSVEDFKIKGNILKLYYDESDLQIFVDESLEDFKEQHGTLTCEAKEAVEREATQEYFNFEFANFFDYCLDMWGASTVKNLSAISVENAKLNNMTLADFWSLTV